MPSILNEALEWLDRAEQAREVAGPGEQCWNLPTVSIGSPEPPQPPPSSGEGSWLRKPRKKPDGFSEAFPSQTPCLVEKRWVTTEDFRSGTSG